MTQTESLSQEEIISMARDFAKQFGSRMCDEEGDTHGEELYAMGIDDIVDIIKLVAQRERDRLFVMFMEAHEGAKHNHNHWHVAANKIRGEA